MRKNLLFSKREWLQVIAAGNHTGCFQVSDPQDHSITWELYFQGKNLQYATSKVGKRERLTCLWNHFTNCPSPNPSIFEKNEYETITNWWNINKLPQSQLGQLLFELSQEALAQMLMIKKPLIEFFPDNQFSDTITTYTWNKTLKKSKNLTEEWQQISVKWISPFSRLYLDSSKTYQFYQFWKSRKLLENNKNSRISFWLFNLAKKNCLYEIAHQRGVNCLNIIQDFQGLLQEEIIEIFPFKNPENKICEAVSIIPNLERDILPANPLIDNNKPKKYSPIVACIDDSKTVQKQLKIILEAVGYQTLSLTDPALSLTALIRHKPVLILMDINMPKVTGYEMIEILQKSQKLQNIPVIMLTGREGVIDRLRAKIVGVSYYLTKPFNPNELIEVVQKLAPNNLAKDLLKT